MRDPLLLARLAGVAAVVARQPRRVQADLLRVHVRARVAELLCEHVDLGHALLGQLHLVRVRVRVRVGVWVRGRVQRAAFAILTMATLTAALLTMAP